MSLCIGFIIFEKLFESVDSSEVIKALRTKEVEKIHVKKTNKYNCTHS